MQYLAVILGIFGLEFGIKNYIEKEKKEGEQEKVGGVLLIRKHHNKGLVLNIGQHRQRLIAAVSVFLTLLSTFLFLLTLGQQGKALLKWGLALLLGGAWSNTYDRVFRRYVVDYVSFQVPCKRIRRIIFNIGDFCIMVGAMMVVLGYKKG